MRWREKWLRFGNSEIEYGYCNNVTILERGTWEDCNRRCLDQDRQEQIYNPFITHPSIIVILGKVQFDKQNKYYVCNPVLEGLFTCKVLAHG